VAASLRRVVASRNEVPASDATTGPAAYSVPTMQMRAPSPQQQLATRPDGPARRSASDDDTTTVERTISVHTVDARTASHTTVIDAPVFGPNATLIGVNTTAPLGYAQQTSATPLMNPAQEAGERTEILTGAVNLPEEPGATRTRVPITELAQNTTPPPVVET